VAFSALRSVLQRGAEFVALRPNAANHAQWHIVSACSLLYCGGRIISRFLAVALGHTSRRGGRGLGGNRLSEEPEFCRATPEAAAEWGAEELDFFPPPPRIREAEDEVLSTGLRFGPPACTYEGSSTLGVRESAAFTRH